jgi:hypothetical protein
MSHRPDSNGNCFCEICEPGEPDDSLLAQQIAAANEAADYAAYERELVAAADEDEYAWERVESGEAPF